MKMETRGESTWIRERKRKREAAGVGFHVMCPMNARASGLGLFCRAGFSFQIFG